MLYVHLKDKKYHLCTQTQGKEEKTAIKSGVEAKSLDTVV